MEPRFKTGGPVRFVSIDGLVVDNLVGLCFDHHLAVTSDVGGHKAWVRWEDDAADWGGGWVWWELRAGEWARIGLLYDRSKDG